MLLSLNISLICFASSRLLRPLSHIRELAARNYRSFTVNKYVCLYKFERDTIYIAHVFHQSQDYGRMV